VPHELLLRLEAVETDPHAVYDVGVDYAIRQCQDLLSHGVEGIHFYTLNKSKATAQICAALGAEHAA
jgi:methylenetetrahydrofolate reductase (NADPH)